ncbi:MAG: hypothetical protein WC882_03815 [Candidatus Gracilibacteria bacterium]
MAYHDIPVLEEIKKHTGGKDPDAYIFSIKYISMWLVILFGFFIQKPYIWVLKGDEFIFIRTSRLSYKKFTGEVFRIKRAEIQDVKFRKFGLAHYLTLIKTNGEKVRFVASHAYHKLEHQKENLEKIKRALGVMA